MVASELAVWINSLGTDLLRCVKCLAWKISIQECQKSESCPSPNTFNLFAFVDQQVPFYGRRMPEIRILADQVANQIAAGEVVERPVAVLKELVENSIDAGASKIEIEFRNGGKSYLRVEDDGAGMTQDQALLSLERHATSKIRKASDLNQVGTFGFRGEALPSIASVSRFVFCVPVRKKDPMARRFLSTGVN